MPIALLDAVPERTQPASVAPAALVSNRGNRKLTAPPVDQELVPVER